MGALRTAGVFLYSLSVCCLFFSIKLFQATAAIIVGYRNTIESNVDSLCIADVKQWLSPNHLNESKTECIFSDPTFLQHIVMFIFLRI